MQDYPDAVAVTALAGGVGAAKFLRGLVATKPAAEVTVIGNTGDDAVFHGLHVSPDLDIVTYTLGGIVDTDKGWGVGGDTRHALDQLGRLGIDTWFWLGDRDFGTHIARTMWLAEGLTLSAIAERIRAALGVGARILPMSDDEVRTRFVTTAGAELEFQDYFVRHHHAEDIASVSFEGAAILAVPGIREALRAARRKVVAVSPIVQGAALRGPADRLLPVVGAEASAAGVAGLYADICATFVVDRRDASEAARIEALGLRPVLLETVMETPEVAAALAKEILALDLSGVSGDGSGQLPGE